MAPAHSALVRQKGLVGKSLESAAGDLKKAKRAPRGQRARSCRQVKKIRQRRSRCTSCAVQGCRRAEEGGGVEEAGGLEGDGPDPQRAGAPEEADGSRAGGWPVYDRQGHERDQEGCRSEQSSVLGEEGDDSVKKVGAVAKKSGPSFKRPPKLGRLLEVPAAGDDRHRGQRAALRRPASRLRSLPTTTACSYRQAREAPCLSCTTSPCCTYLLLGDFQLERLLDIDHALYLLNFDGHHAGTGSRPARSTSTSTSRAATWTCRAGCARCTPLRSSRRSASSTTPIRAGTATACTVDVDPERPHAGPAPHGVVGGASGLRRRPPGDRRAGMGRDAGGDSGRFRCSAVPGAGSRA